MAYGYFNIKYTSMDQFYSDICQKITEWNQELDSWNQSYNKIVEMESFKGNSADGVKTYLQEVHGVLLFSIKQMLADFQSRFLLYKTGYYDIESNIYADISEETIRFVISKLTSEIPVIESVDNRIDSALNSTEDLLALGTPSKFYLQDTIEGLQNDLKSFCITIDEYENSQNGIVNSELDGLISSVKNLINDYIINGTNVASYKSGDLAKNTYVLDLVDKVQKSSDYIKENMDAIESAVEEQQEVYIQMQKDYEEACKSREDKGLANLIMGGVAVVVGVVAIVGTAGMATPIVVTAAVSGGCTIAYGASNMIEGGQDMYYGSIGDLSSAAFNPIRDTAFCGNQGLYDAWGKLNMTVAGLCIPVGKAVNTVAGSSTKVIVETAAKTVVKESLKDVAFDTVSGEVVRFADEKLDLNQTEEVLLNLTVNTVLDKGTDFVSEKIKGKPSMVEDMSFEDAKKYNDYWDEVEKGTHNTPDMNDIDMKAWEVADAKLDDNFIKGNLDTITVDIKGTDVKDVDAKDIDMKDADGSSTDWDRTSLTSEQEAIIKDMEQNNEFIVEENKGRKVVQEDYGPIETTTDFVDPKQPGRHLPTENSGTIVGDRDSGNFEFTPDDQGAQTIMKQYGQETIKYKNNEPDFSPYTKHDTQWGEVDCEVQIEAMSGSRTSSGGNYSQADEMLSRKISQETGKDVSPTDIKKYRESNGLTWHETNDGYTMQLIPTEINSRCPHRGGTSIKAEQQAWGNVSHSYD